MKCICSGSHIKCIESIADLNQEDAVFKQDKRSDSYTERAENRMWLDGIVKNASAGYGSSHDGDMFVIAVCDKCITIKKEDGTIAYTGNYMGFDSEITQLDEYRKIWRRANNLDELI